MILNDVQKIVIKIMGICTIGSFSKVINLHVIVMRETPQKTWQVTLGNHKGLRESNEPIK